MDFFFELHSNIPREGPGNDAATANALSMVHKLPEKPKILDLGCGPGKQTLTLAKITGGDITAVDIHQPFLDELNRRAKSENLSSYITTLNCSMSSLDLEEKTFDLIWSEGAIYIMGFSEGLQAWHRFLKSGGSLAVTDVSWFVKNPPEEIKKFFMEEYPKMKLIEETIDIIIESGWSFTGCFTLPESAWWDDYYIPLEKRIMFFREKYSSDKNILNILDESQKEIDLYRKYSNYYGYVFYIMQKSTDNT